MLIQHARWHFDADVVIVGYGAAGAAAAITAHDAGTQVVILEKQGGQKHITNSSMSGGGIICPNDIQAARRYMEALYKVNDGLYWTEPDVLGAWVEYSAENVKWFESLGGAMDLYRHGGEHKAPGAESIDICQLRGGMGSEMMRLLYDQVKARNIQVMYETSAAELLLNSRGEVVGVTARQNTDKGHMVNIRARRAVILATGGFEFDEQMKLQYLKVYPSYYTASPSDTGDGIRMALGAGAQLWHMNCSSGACVMKFPEVPCGLHPMFGGRHWVSPGGTVLPGYGGKGLQGRHARQLKAIAGYIVVDRYGKRYTNENLKTHSFYYELTLFDSRKLIYPRVPSYWIFDQRRMNDSPLVRQTHGPAGEAGFYKWSSDNSKELGQGWIKQGNTIKELAIKLGIEDRTLAETVDNYNLYCRHGEDAECHREPDYLIPLAQPPYYAVELWPGGRNTQGGPRRNSKAQVVRADGKPVPRLYSAGELGSIFGMLYPAAGGNLAECIAFGRIAAEETAKLHPL